MNDLHTRFRSLDDVPAPDLWREAENRAQALQHTGGRTLSLALVALLLLLTLAVGTAALIGSGVIKFPALVVDASATPNDGTPYPSATAEQDLVLGGGLMLVHSSQADTATDAFDAFTLDAGTGKQTLLGTLPNVGPYNFQWGTDRKHVLIIGNAGLTPLDNQTDAGGQLTFICCELPKEPVALPSGVGKPGVTVAPVGGWVLSPQSDRIAGLHGRLLNLPGCLMCSTADAVVIMDGDGRNLRTLPLPQGTQGDSPISWSPDGSAVLVSGCRPCNNALYSSPAGLATDPSKLTPTAVEHAHVYVVPVDGSAVQELLDETETRFFSPAWSPDGTTIAFSAYVCGADEHAPYCGNGTGALETLVVADGRRTVIADEASTSLAWSPDGRRLAFVGNGGIFVMDRDGSHATKVGPDGEEPRWSPDGQWLLFSIHGQGLRAPTIPWIVQVDGGQPRLLGPYGGWAW